MFALLMVACFFILAALLTSSEDGGVTADKVKDGWRQSKVGT